VTISRSKTTDKHNTTPNPYILHLDEVYKLLSPTVLQSDHDKDQRQQKSLLSLDEDHVTAADDGSLAPLPMLHHFTT
jgi:hypothetical protein